MASNIKNLKTRLKQLGAKTLGNKPELQKRLSLWQNLDLSRSKCPANVVPSDCQLGFTDDDGPYHALEKLDRKQVEWLSPTIITVYFKERGAGKGDIQGRKLFHSLFCKTIVFYDSVEHGLFFKIKCSAETKKSIDYEIRLHLSKSERSIMKANCICPAGHGTSSACKHISAILYAIEFYGMIGEIKLNKPCTDTLQTWHHPKGGRNLEKISIDDMLCSAINTPNPCSSRTDDFLNGIINFGISSPAIYCRNSIRKHVFHDHAYCRDPLSLLNLNSINFTTLKDRQEIERTTRGQGIRWKNERKTRITASMCHSILTTVKSKKFSTLFLKYHINDLCINSSALKWGIKNEETARREYEKIIGVKILSSGLIIDEKHHFLAATPDGVNENKSLLLEIKCPYSCRNGKPTDASYIRKGQLNKNHKYYTQCQVQMHVAKIEILDFVVWTPQGIFIQNVSYDKGTDKNRQMYILYGPNLH